MPVSPSSSPELCPNCDQPNLYSAAICECGYDFQRQLIVAPDPPAGGTVGSAPADRVYGGIGRVAYLVYLVAIGAVVALVDAAVDPGLLELVVVTAALLAAVYVVALRFRNQGATGWWALAAFVPFVNVYVGVRALAFPEGYVDHRKIDIPGKAVVFLALAIIVVVIVTALAA